MIRSVLPRKKQVTPGLLGRAFLAIILSLFIITSSGVVCYEKAYATGAEGIIALGTVAPPVALVALLALGGVCAYEAYQNREQLVANGQALWEKWSDFIVAGSDTISTSEAYQWLTNVGQGHLYNNEVFQNFRAFLRSLTTSSPQYGEILGNTVTYNGQTFEFSPTIYRSEVTGTPKLILSHKTDQTRDIYVACGSNTDPVYYALYNWGDTDRIAVAVGSATNYRGSISTMSGIQSGLSYPSNGSTTMGRGLYWQWNIFDKSEFSNASGLPLSITSDGFSIMSKFDNLLKCQAWLQVWGNFEDTGAGTHDDVIVKNPSLVDGGLYSHNDVITKGAEWGLITGGDVAVVDGVIDYPLDIPIEWVTVQELIDILNDIISGRADPLVVGDEIGVIPYDPSTDWTIADDPAKSRPVVETKPSKPKPGTDIPDNDKPFTLPYDLTGVFPFCIPFDFIAFLGLLNSEPETPVFQVGLPDPITGELITTDVDLHDFDGLAEIIRNFECLLFIFFLLVNTRANMIKG